MARLRRVDSGYEVYGHHFNKVPLAARRDLLRVLASPSNVRADVIRQFHERGKDSMVEVLVELEADELLRAQVIEVLLTTVI